VDKQCIACTMLLQDKYFPVFLSSKATPMTAMFEDLDRLLPVRCVDELGPPGSRVDSSLCLALSVLENRDIIAGPIIVLKYRDMTVAQVMTHVGQSHHGRITLSALVRTSSICKCSSLGPVPVQIMFERALADSVKEYKADLGYRKVDRRYPKPRTWKTMIMALCFHCRKQKSVMAGPTTLVAIPRQPRAGCFFGRRAVRAAAFAGNRIRFNYLFDGPDYILPTEGKHQALPGGAPIDIITTPDVGSLLAWNTIRVASGRGARNKWLRSVASLVLVSKAGPAGPWTFRVTHHGSQVRTLVSCHRDASDLIITCHGLQDHIRVRVRKDASSACRTIDDIAQWHASARAGSRIADNQEIDDHDPDGVRGTAVKVEE
jgi:hypothetical protein